MWFEYLRKRASLPVGIETDGQAYSADSRYGGEARSCVVWRFAGGSDAVQLFALSFSGYRVGQGSYADFKFARPFRHIVLIK